MKIIFRRVKRTTTFLYHIEIQFIQRMRAEIVALVVLLFSTTSQLESPNCQSCGFSRSPKVLSARPRIRYCPFKIGVPSL